MALVFHDYEVDVFNLLPHFNEAKNQIPFVEINKLGDLIKKHNVANVGVNLLHKHFDLHKGEMLVEVQSDNLSAIRPQPEGSSATILPYLWRATSDGWVPLEFTEVVTPENRARVVAVMSSQDFLAEFHGVLLELKVPLIFLV